MFSTYKLVKNNRISGYMNEFTDRPQPFIYFVNFERDFAMWTAQYHKTAPVNILQYMTLNLRNYR